VPEPIASGSFTHLAVFYDSVESYTVQVAEFLRGGLRAGQPAFVAVPPAQAGWLREELGAASAAVRFEDITEVGRNPARIIPLIQGFINQHAGRHIRYVGEPIWRSRSMPEIREATRHEALVNLAFAEANAAIVCPYDISALNPDVVKDAQRTHPVLQANGLATRSPEYTRPGDIPASCQAPLTAQADAMAYTYTGDLSAVRALVESEARAARLPGSKVIDLVLAVSEAAANTLEHAHSPGTLDIVCDDHEIVCTLRDKGVITDPLVGRRQPPLGATEGHGLWLVHQVCDLVELRSDESGTTIRLHMHVSPH
jgi:anti-sigma regulatory factor (Ser/Thr protein kinase)